MEREIKILITGDFYAGNRIDQLIQENNYNDIYNDFLPLIKDSDLAITNLESVLTNELKPIIKTGPALRASTKTIGALKFAGFNLLTLANNHIMDYGKIGLSDTIDLCKDNNIETVGAGMNLDEASRIFYKTISNKKIAILNITENEWSTTQGEEAGANPLNPVSNYYSIVEAKKNADFVFVIIHGGHEQYDLPSPRMKQTYRFFIDAGANVVVGHHTHCYSGYEEYKGSPIFYSLGNFVFDLPSKRNSLWNNGFAVQFTLRNEDIRFEIVPYTQNNIKPGVHLLKKLEKLSFFKNLETLNNFIRDDIMLKTKFDEYCSKASRLYRSFLEPHSNKYLHAMQNRNLFPSLISKKKRLFFLNIMRCEAHRDVIFKILSE